jgi:transposase-like protein
VLAEYLGIYTEVIDPATKAAAIAELLTGEQPVIVAERYKINRSTIRTWKRQYAPTTDVTTEGGAVVSSVVSPIVKPAIDLQHLAIGDLVLANLRAKLIATQRIAEHASISEWLEKQSAGELATLFEAIDRSAIGILDRMAGSGQRADDERGKLADASAAEPAPPDR